MDTTTASENLCIVTVAHPSGRRQPDKWFRSREALDAYVADEKAKHPFGWQYRIEAYA